MIVNLASTSPGVLSGDRLEVKVDVAPDARMLLTMPSASRIHTMTAGHAELRQVFHVSAGGMLDYWPEYLIPQARSRYRQRNMLHVEPRGTLLWTESLAPGRTASGEIFAFSELRIATDLHVGEAHVARERYSMTKGDATQRALLRQFPTPYYASILCVSPRLASAGDALSRLGALHDGDHVWTGASRLTESARVVKVIAAGSPELRQTIAAIRAELYSVLNVGQPAIRRTTGESRLHLRVEEPMRNAAVPGGVIGLSVAAGSTGG